jgi:cellulose synthase/poly-beta-1,6-N-acetylglucosamine synthase-like glycosyltransferase
MIIKLSEIICKSAYYLIPTKSVTILGLLSAKGVRMKAWQIIFLISCLVVFYNYAGYALLLSAINLFKRRKKNSATQRFTPSVSFIVAAYNEEEFIEKKIQNSFAQNYPAEKIEYIFITDGSTDRTTDIIEKYPRVKLMHEAGRKGKSAALNRAVQAASNDILIFSDANTILNEEATANIARHYQYSNIGGVAGEKKVIDLSETRSEASAGEGLYWKYESILKKIDSDFYSVVGAAGELFSLRRALYEPIGDHVILDDFIISLRTAQKGYRVLYEPDAYAMESPSFSIRDEKKRKIRIAAGGFQAIGILRSLLLFWKNPRLSFLYISHRLLRWTLSPLCFMLAFLSNTVLFFISDNPLYKVLFVVQLCFYAMAMAAAFNPNGNRFRIMKLPYYFAFMNLAVVLGFFRFIQGKQSSVWEKAKRKQPGIL